jgi:hypothetical protein
MANERPVFYRERASRLYAALPYAVAQVGCLDCLSCLGCHGLTPTANCFMQAVVEVPFVAVQAIWYTIITFFMIHFQYTAAKVGCDREFRNFFQESACLV